MQESNRIKAVIFDLGGVIYRTEDPIPRTRLAESMGLSRAELEAIVFANPVALAGERGDASEADAWKETARLLSLPEAQIPAFRDAFFAGDRVDQELVEFIRSLRPTYTTALLSNNWSPDLEHTLRERLGIYEAFDVVISSAQRRVRKPDPEIFHYALEIVGARPKESIFVDDFEANTRAAASLGLHVVWFRATEQAVAELRALLQME